MYLLFNEVEDMVLDRISALLPYKMDPIEVGFKYIGHRLKPLNYCINDWRWDLKIFEQRISLWFYRLLSLGGRLILIRAVP